MLAAFTILLIIRKIKDWYLRATIGLLLGALGLRILIISTMFFRFDEMIESAESLVFFDMKASVFEYTIPVYLFQTVLLALLFSTYTTYKAMYVLVFPHEQELEMEENNDDDNFVNNEQASEVRLKKHWLKKRHFLVLQILLILGLIVYSTASMFADDDGYSKSHKMGFALKFAIAFPVVALYCVQIISLGLAFYTLYQLLSLKNIRPECMSKLC